MKKLIAMIGAVAMSFGLFADAYTISFEQAEVSKGVDTSTMLFAPVVSAAEWAWTGDPLPITAYGEEPTFEYGTGAFARRVGFDGEDANDNYLPLETGTDELVRFMNGNLCLDQLVKFTGFEDPQTNLVSGTKIAIWMSEFENEDETTTTNLYVTVGKVDALGAVEQIALKIDGTYALNTWYRLSIKSLGNVFGTSEEVAPHAGFLVYVNGAKVASSDEDATALIATTTYMTPAAKKYMDEGQLFTAIDDSNATFASVGYQGIGAVDDIFIDANGPAFAVETVDVTFTDIDNAVIAKVVDSNGTEFDHPTTAIPVKPGTLTVTLAAAPGYKLFGETDYEVTATVAGPITINTTGKTTFEQVVATLTVGEDDPVGLAEKELAGALDALNEGDMITTILSCVVTNGEAVTLYSITPNTIIARTEYGWSVYVGNYEDSETQESVGGLFTDYVGAADGFKKLFEFESADAGFLNLNGAVAGEIEVTVGGVYTEGNIPVSGVLKAPAIYLDGVTITLSDAVGAKVMETTGALTDEQILVPDNYTLDKQGPDAADYYTYSAAQSGPEPATYNITFDEVENGTLETSVTNGIVAGTTVTVTATPATGYECTQITTNGSALVDTTTFKMPAKNVEIGATFALQQFTVADISVENATAVATNTATETGLNLPATVDYNTAIAVTVTPDTDYEYATPPAGWTKNENGSITTNATVTANLAITVEAPTKKAADPVDPEVPTHYDTTKEAEDAAKAINDNKETMIKTPEGAVAADYTALFTAVVKGTDVVVELNQAGTNALETAAATIETAVATKLDDIAAATAGSSVEVTVTEGVKNGFWYGVAATAELTAMGTTEPTEWAQAKDGSVTIKATKPTTGNAAFFQTRAKVKAPVAEEPGE